MIIDSLRSFERYVSINKNFSDVLDFLKGHNLHSMEPGKTIIKEGDIWCSIWEGKGKSPEEARLEIHDSFIDIQILLEGDETYGFMDRALCNTDGVKYDEINDIAFMNEQPQVYISGGIDNFIIFFPKDAHAPLIGNGEIKKAIIKVRV